MKFLIICGYANTGKTTLMNKSGMNICSTSVVLDRITARFIQTFYQPFRTLPDIEADLRNKTIKIGQMCARQLKIAVAEEVIVPTLGRESLVRSALRDAEELGINLFESIGGEELLLIIKEIEQAGHSYHIVNLLHADSQPGIDKRELAGCGLTVGLPSKYITNLLLFHNHTDLLNLQIIAYNSPYCGN